MKKYLLFSLVIILSMKAEAQPNYCPFIYYVTPGTNTVTFSPNSNYTGGQYHYLWEFGDSTTSTLSNPIHTYSSSHPYYVTCFTYDAINNPVCSTGDTIYIIPPYICHYPSVMILFVSDSLEFATQPLSGAHIEWDFGDGTGIFTSNPIVHVYTQVGIFNCTYFQKDSSGNILCQYTEVLNIYGTHGCSFYVGNYFQNTVELISTTHPGYVVHWDFGDNTTDTGGVVQHTYNSPGFYNVSFVAFDSLGDTCRSIQTVQAGTSGWNCYFSVTPDSLPNTYTFTDTLQGPYTVTWDFGDQSGDSGITVTHTYANAGSYAVWMYKTDTNGILACQNFDTINVGGLICSFTSASSILDSLTIDFSVPQTNYKVNWDFGDGTTATGMNPSHTFSGFGTYLVCMNEEDSLTNVVLCQHCSWIQINSTSSPCQASFFATNQGLNAYFVDMSTADSSSIVNYSWDFGDGGTSIYRFPQHLYQLPGTYNACLIINSSNCTDTFCNAVAVDTNQVINTSCNAFFAIIQTAPFDVAIVNLSTGNLFSSWDFGDGTNDTLPYPTHLYNSTGAYNLCLTISDGNGCISTYCDSLNVDSLGNLFRTSTQGFSLVVVSPQQITTAVIDLKSSAPFKIFPNPFESEIYLNSFSSSKIESYTIFSMLGSKVLSGKIGSSQGKINTANLGKGTYLLEVLMNDGTNYHNIILK